MPGDNVVVSATFEVESKPEPTASATIAYCTHVQTIGWQDYVCDGAMSGTNGQSKRLEAIQIRLTGNMAKHFDVWYRAHVQGRGWLSWAKNGETAGAVGESKRLEAVQVLVVPKGTRVI